MKYFDKVEDQFNQVKEICNSICDQFDESINSKRLPEFLQNHLCNALIEHIGSKKISDSSDSFNIDHENKLEDAKSKFLIRKKPGRPKKK